METLKNETKAISPTREGQNGAGAQGRYDELKSERLMYEQRARECARLTIPMLFREEGANSASTLSTPWQGLGARGVKVLTAKMLLAILPANSPFWRYLLTEAAMRGLEDNAEARTEMEKDLSLIERTVQDYIESNSHRPKIAELIQQLIVAGNALLFLAPTGKARVYRMSDYVVHRDPVGTWLEILAHEKVSPLSLPEHVRAMLDQTESTQKTIDVFTWVKRTATNYQVHQEVAGKVVPGSDGTYPLDACPWIPLRFYAVDGESYGRSYVEEYLGDLVSLELLSQAVTEGSVSAARVVYGLKPGSTTKMQDLEKAENNQIIKGDLVNDVTTLRLDKFNDFRVAMESAQTIQTRLEQAFMMNSSVQRQAERVTAEEVRFMAQELEDVLGGIYSILAQEFQLPYLKAIFANLKRLGVLPDLPEHLAAPVIVTGLGALGRGQDLNKLQLFLQQLQPFGEQAFGVLNMDNLMMRVAMSLGIDTRGLIKTQEQIQAEQQAAAMAQMAQQVGPQMVQGAMQNPDAAAAMMAGMGGGA